MKRPEETEYYPGYKPYIDLVEAGDFIELLDKNTASTIDFFRSIDSAKENFKYAENKWSVKEVFMHMIDTERGFSYRAIVCARRDSQTVLYAMDEDHFARNVDLSEVSLEQLIEEFIAVRQAFKFIYTNNPNEEFDFLGTGTTYKISARAIGYIAIGHMIHHIAVIQERYLD